MEASGTSVNRCSLLPVQRSRELHGYAESVLHRTVGITAAIDVMRLATDKCGISLRIAELEERYEGWLDTRIRPHQMVINSTKPFYRRRFTTAHEIGHYLLHDFGDVLHRDSEETVFGTDGGDSAIPRQELEASEFAAAVLMPASRVAEFKVLELTGDCWRRLSQEFQVSEPAAKQRLYRLVPSLCFQGEAFLNSGKLIFVYPSLELEEQVPVSAETAWRLNGSVKSNRIFLPRAVIESFQQRLTRSRPVGGLSPRFSPHISAVDWPDALDAGVSGSLTLLPVGSDRVYFRFDFAA